MCGRATHTHTTVGKALKTRGIPSDGKTPTHTHTHNRWESLKTRETPSVGIHLCGLFDAPTKEWGNPSGAFNDVTNM